MQRMN